LVAPTVGWPLHDVHRVRWPQPRHEAPINLCKELVSWLVVHSCSFPIRISLQNVLLCHVISDQQIHVSSYI
jgi:hypothetical protein